MAKQDLEEMQSELANKLGEIEAICKSYGYSATPTLVLRHEEGAECSLLLSNDSLGSVVMCIAELGETGLDSWSSVPDSALKVFTS
jgi:hypothetical protein